MCCWRIRVASVAREDHNHRGRQKCKRLRMKYVSSTLLNSSYYWTWTHQQCWSYSRPTGIVGIEVVGTVDTVFIGIVSTEQIGTKCLEKNIWWNSYSPFETKVPRGIIICLVQDALFSTLLSLLILMVITSPSTLLSYFWSMRWIVSMLLCMCYHNF